MLVGTQAYAWNIMKTLKQFGWLASLNHNIYIATDPTPLDVDHAAHAGGPTMCTQRIMTTHLL